jgi:hypothetical protein
VKIVLLRPVQRNLFREKIYPYDPEYHRVVDDEPFRPATAGLKKNVSLQLLFEIQILNVNHKL